MTISANLHDVRRVTASELPLPSNLDLGVLHLTDANGNRFDVFMPYATADAMARAFQVATSEPQSAQDDAAGRR
jgi:hypothetical protein